MGGEGKGDVNNVEFFVGEKNDFTWWPPGMRDTDTHTHTRTFYIHKELQVSNKIYMLSNFSFEGVKFILLFLQCIFENDTLTIYVERASGSAFIILFF
jgi:hypothetical protein